MANAFSSRNTCEKLVEVWDIDILFPVLEIGYNFRYNAEHRKQVLEIRLVFICLVDVITLLVTDIDILINIFYCRIKTTGISLIDTWKCKSQRAIIRARDASIFARWVEDVITPDDPKYKSEIADLMLKMMTDSK